MNNGDNLMRSPPVQTMLSPKAVESLAIEALTLIAGDPALAARFMSLSGFDPGSLRMAAKRPDFLAGVLDYVMTDEGSFSIWQPRRAIVPKRSRQPVEASIPTPASKGRQTEQAPTHARLRLTCDTPRSA